jgi:hypothetical protein
MAENLKAHEVYEELITDKFNYQLGDKSGVVLTFLDINEKLKAKFGITVLVDGLSAYDKTFYEIIPSKKLEDLEKVHVIKKISIGKYVFDDKTKFDTGRRIIQNYFKDIVSNHTQDVRKELKLGAISIPDKEQNKEQEEKYFEDIIAKIPKYNPKAVPKKVPTFEEMLQALKPNEKNSDIKKAKVILTQIKNNKEDSIDYLKTLDKSKKEKFKEVINDFVNVAESEESSSKREIGSLSSEEEEQDPPTYHTHDPPIYHTHDPPTYHTDDPRDKRPKHESRDDIFIHYMKPEINGKNITVNGKPNVGENIPFGEFEVNDALNIILKIKKYMDGKIEEGDNYQISLESMEAIEDFENAIPSRKRQAKTKFMNSLREIGKKILKKELEMQKKKEESKHGTAKAMTREEKLKFLKKL